MRVFSYCLLAAFLSVAIATAQVAGTGSIQGTVTDPSGAAIAGASVTAKNVATGVETARKSTEAGLFVLPLLIPGEYTVTVKATGFESLTQTHVVVEALATVAVNPTTDRSARPTRRSPWKPSRPP